MIELTKELMESMDQFKMTFGDIVPLREIPQTATAEQVISAIRKSIEEKQDLLSQIFGFQKLEDDPNILC